MTLPARPCCGVPLDQSCGPDGLTRVPLVSAIEVYAGSNGDATLAFYRRLEALGPSGFIAMNLFRACKSSERAKVYRGGVPGRGSYRGMAYDRKQWALQNLDRALSGQKRLGDGETARLGEPTASPSPRLPVSASCLPWGWKKDPAQPVHSWVLYVDLPTGQASFHTSARLSPMDYPGDWDGVRDATASRIIRWCDQLLAVPLPVS